MGSFFITQIHPAMLHTATSLRLYTSPYFNANYTIIPLLLWLIYCLVVYTSMPLRVHACTPLRFYASLPIRLYASTPLLLYGFTPPRMKASMLLCLYASTPLRLYACKIVVLYSAVSYWGGYNRHKREAESSLESRMECSFSRHPA